MSWGHWFDPDLADLPQPRKRQLELAEWVEAAPGAWQRRVKEWGKVGQ